MTAFMEMIEPYRFWITIGVGIVVLIILAVMLHTSSKKKAAKKAAKKSAQGKRKAGSGAGGVQNVDSDGMPLDDDDDSEYRDSNLYGKQKKADKEEYFKDWD